MDYSFVPFKELAKGNGFGYPVDVYYGTVYLGTLVAEAEGFTIKMVATANGRQLVKQSPNNNFKSQALAAQVLHRVWKNMRNGESNEQLNEFDFPKQKPQPSSTPINGPNLLIPDFEEDGEKYPGDIQPGYYDPRQLVILLLYHLDNPDALQFIADMMETGIPEKDEFVQWLRRNKSNEKALSKAALGWKQHI